MITKSQTPIIQCMEELTPEQIKSLQSVAKEALKLVQDGMTVGLGTGRSATIFIKELLKEQERKKLKIKCVATSLRSKALIQGQIESIDDSLIDSIDITFDGADRVDTQTLCLIKGGGGALLREKLVAKRSKTNMILVDESKLCSPLQGFPLPVEIVEFGHQSTIDRLSDLGFKGELRRKRGSMEIAKSDNGNYIFDITLQGPIKEPHATHLLLKQTLGVIETGLFLDTTTKVYVGQKDGNVKILEA